jgi:uncharacterized repeat protein (TIGR01451 family)
MRFFIKAFSLLAACVAVFLLLPSASGMRSRGGEVSMKVNASGASYPLTIDPLIQQQKLQASVPAVTDLFGQSVSLSGDTAIVGAYEDDNSGGVDAGSAYVLTRSGGVWTEQQRLQASDAAADDFFGFSVAVSGDTAMVGAINGRNALGQHTGAVYVFTRSGGVWTQQQRLQPSDVALNDQFGRCVSISGDTLVVTSVADDHGGEQAGSAYIFTRSNGVWTQQQKLQAADRKAGANFGQSLALDGDTVVVGAWQDNNTNGTAAGAAYVFTRVNGVWTQQQKLIATNFESNGFFGGGVTLSGDTVIVGGDGNNRGAAYVFTRSAGVWTPQQRIQPSDISGGDIFGGGVALSGDVAVITSPNDDNSGGADAGSAYVFTRDAGAWTERQKLTASDGAANDGFGNSVAFDGNTAVFGAAQDDNSGGADAGSAYVFVFPPTPTPTPSPTPTPTPTPSPTPTPTPSADVLIMKTASVNPAEVGRIFTYNIEVSNAGPDAANAVTVTDALPAGMTFTSATPSQGSCDFASGTLTCQLGALAMNGSASVVLQVKPRQTGTLTNTASVTAAESDPDTSDNDATSTINVIKTADLKIAKTDSPDPVFVGEQVTYTLLVTNLGTLNTATGVTLTDSLPTSMTFVSATTTQGSLVTPPVGSTGVITADIASLAVNAQATVTVTVKATQSGSITNTATVSGNETDTNNTNNTATQTTTVKDAALQKVLLVKQVLTGGCENTMGNVYLTGSAPLGGVTISLSSNVTGASAPSGIFIPAGQTVSPVFVLTTSTVTTKQVGLVTATLGTSSVSRNITINVGNGTCQ